MRVEQGGNVRQVKRCVFNTDHQFVTERCPICQPDVLDIRRTKKAYESELEARQLMQVESHWRGHRRAHRPNEDPTQGYRASEEPLYGVA